MADQSVEAVLARIDKKTRGSANQIAGKIVILLEDNVQEHVYDYYDEIRSGYYVEEKYDRTKDLKNGWEVERGRGQARVVNKKYDSETIDRIQTGETSWKRSVLFQLSPSQRARPFFDRTIGQVNDSIDNYFVDYMAGNKLIVRKK